MTNDVMTEENLEPHSEIVQSVVRSVKAPMVASEADIEFEFVIQTKDLAHSLGFASSVVEKKNASPELSNVKLTVTDNFLEIAATDVDIFLTQTIGAATKIVQGHAVTTVPTRTFSDVVRKIPDQEFTIRKLKTSDSLELIGKNCRFELLSPAADKFQTMEDINSTTSLQVPCSELSRIIEHTIFSASDDETRYNLNGIYLHSKEGRLYSAATDGHRLSVAAVNGDKFASEDFGVIIPKKTVQEILKIVKDQKHNQSDIEISIATNRIKFKCNNIVLISKLIDGTFPEYSAFFPANNNNKLVIAKELFDDAIDRASMVTVDKFRAVKLVISKDNIEITASGEAKGAAREVVEASEEEDKFYEFDGNEISIGLNPKYLTDVLRALKEKKVEFYFSDGYSPVLVKTANNPYDSFVIMPVKV